jgi:murein DD-endopeptidase MepM/ murein hydrolase activator NlpD
MGRGVGALTLAAALAACAPTSQAVVSRPPRPPPARPDLPELPGADDGRDTAGVVHVVKKGQNLYRIARAYGIEVADLMETNGITDPRSVAVGQELFIPGARELLEVEPAPGPLPARPPPDGLPRRPDPDARPAAVRPAPRPAAPAAAPAPDPEPVALEKAPPRPAPILAWPLKGVLYGRYGVRGKARHDGIDIAAPMGTAIAAADDGTVLFVGDQSGYGKVVILRHERNLVTVYAHNSEVLVREGQRVARGQAISRVGQTGRTTGPHLHFEVREGVKPRNPLLYLP